MKLTYAMLLAAGLAMASPSHAEPTLKSNVTVAGPLIRLGDLFTDAGSHANDVLSQSPPPGMRTTYSAEWLRAIAEEHHLAWAPSSDFTQAVVDRATRVIDAESLVPILLKAMPVGVKNAERDIQLDNPNLRISVASEASNDIGIDNLNLEPRSGRFSATVVAPAGAMDAQRQRVSGRLVVEIEVAAPNRAIAIDEIIGAADIEEIKLPRERLPADAVTDASELIGKSARHLLRADQPLRAGDVQEPLVVRKGDLVTIEIRTPTMDLSAQGKALEDGALGAAVRVTNTQSNRVVETTAAGPNLVRAGGPSKLAAR